MSRTGLSPADIAKSFRDRCGDGSVEWVYTPMHACVLLDAADMLEENDRLRNEFRKMDEWHSKELLAAVDENAKLRELVRTFYHCTTSGECDECPVNGGGPVHLMPDTICDTIHDRMRELGVDA